MCFYPLVSSRSSSREGSRIAKELLQSLQDVDENSMDIPLSSIIAHSQMDGDDGEISEDDIDENLLSEEEKRSGGLGVGEEKYRVQEEGILVISYSREVSFFNIQYQCYYNQKYTPRTTLLRV